MPLAGTAAWLVSGLVCGALPQTAAAQALVTASPTGTLDLPTIDVTPLTPLGGTNVDPDKLPLATTRIDRQEITRTQSPNIVRTLDQQVPSITLNEPSGNEFQPDVVFRGFTASPVSGTPEGLAVYQNGVRINESFGDIVNWDLLPTFAIADIDVVTNNPAFGLNALGGAITIRMKDGFTFQGGTMEIQGGSFGRLQGGFEYGKQVGNYSVYGALEGIRETGFRRFSGVDIARFYGDVGYRAEGGEYHLNIGLADNSFGDTASAPIELLQQNYGAVYTTPQTTRNQLAFFNLTGTLPLTATWALQANAYLRFYNQRHVDGNTTDAQACDADPTTLCFGDGATPANGTNGQQLANPFPDGSAPGELDRTRTRTRSEGGSIQATNTDLLFGHTNHFVTGASIDYGTTQFSAATELGTINTDFVTQGLGVTLGASGDPISIGPVALTATNVYGGLFAVDTFDVTNRLSLTAGARLNIADIDLNDREGQLLNGESMFTRINPLVGGTYKVTDGLTVYAGYSEANRAPTPLELGCADPLRPCTIDNFLVSDPPLKQVVARTVEAGIRGVVPISADFGTFGYKLGGFRTENQDDILNVPSEVQGFGYFQNVGTTLRQGIELELNVKSDRWFAYLNYAAVDATFQTPILLSSPNNPQADENGDIQVKKGDHIPLVPLNRLKLGLDYLVTPAWTIGGDLLYTGSQYFVGDEANLNSKLPSYVTVDLHTTYRLNQTFEFFGRIENLFDNHYYNYGTYFETDAIAFADFNDPRSVSPGRPRSFYGGIRAKF